MRRFLYLTVSFIIVLLLFWPHQPMSSQTAIEEPQRVYEYLNENQECLACHGQEYYYYYNDWIERDVKERMNPYRIVDSTQFYESNHWNFRCIDCHSEDYASFPHPGELRMEPKYECIDCHGGDEDYAILRASKKNSIKVFIHQNTLMTLPAGCVIILILIRSMQGRMKT